MLISAITAVVLTTTWQAHVSEIANGLLSTDPGTRAVAFAELEAASEQNADILKNRSVQIAVISLLDTENSIIRDNYATTLVTGANRLSEGFSEYYANILAVADQLRAQIPPGDPHLRARLLKALVWGAYNGDSPFAIGLASEGEPLVAFVLDLIDSPVEADRWNALDLTAHIFRHQHAYTLKSPLSPSSAARLQQLARRALDSPHAAVRRHAVEAVVAARNVAALPKLLEMARNDPDVDTGPIRLSVRCRAADAVLKLQGVK